MAAVTGAPRRDSLSCALQSSRPSTDQVAAPGTSEPLVDKAAKKKAEDAAAKKNAEMVARKSEEAKAKKKTEEDAVAKKKAEDARKKTRRAGQSVTAKRHTREQVIFASAFLIVSVQTSHVSMHLCAAQGHLGTSASSYTHITSENNAESSRA